MLTIKILDIYYGSNKVVEDFNLSMEAGQIIGIVGESGSGKTTVIRSIIGLLANGGKAASGDIEFNGESLLKKSERDMLKLRGSEISMIFQDSGAMMNPVRRIGSQFIEYLKFHEKMSKAEAYAKCIEMLKLMRLPDEERIMRSYPFQLSGGQKQRVGIAMAMSFTPKLLLADEPTSALDVTIQAQIVRQMLEMRDICGTGIILVTHNLGVAAYMSDYILVMKNGRVVESGERDRIINDPEDEYTRKLIDSIPVMDGEIYV